MKMRTSFCLAVPAAMMALFVGSAKAALTLSASAQIALTSSVGANNNYTITVNNTGTDTIGTFWFAWTPPADPIEYDFLPTTPSAAAGPAGWIAPTLTAFPGTSIEFYNITGSDILPGQSGTFTFTTTDTPTTLQGTSLGFPITTSFIYDGFPEASAAVQVNPTIVATPEPASVGALGIVGLALLKRRRR
jgi:hypothetical protein